jgi:5'-3' exonuclease
MNYDKFTLLVDGNALGYAWQQATKLTSGSQPTQAAYGMLIDMRTLRQDYPGATPLVLWDGRAEWRFALHPDYKSNRRSTPERVAMKEAYASQKPYIQGLLRHLGIRQITAFTHEADDLAGHFVRKLSVDPRHRIGCITGDGDWLQFVRRNVFWRDMRDGSRLVTARNFYEWTGCRTPLQFLERKCLMGDSSDVISGVGGIGEKGAIELIATFGSVREFWRQCDSGAYKPKSKAEKSLWRGECEHDKEAWAALYAGDPTDAKALKKHQDAWPGQGRAIFRRNFQLMQLLKVTPPNPADIHVDKGCFDPEAFAAICEELAFASILKQLDAYLDHFKPKELST